jgi:hypothetical protein
VVRTLTDSTKQNAIMEVMEKIKEKFGFHHSFRTYFDWCSDEFNRTKIEKKAEIIEAIIVRGFNFHQLIKEYKEYYNKEGYKHIYDATIPTLIMLISYFKTGKLIDPYTEKLLQNKSEKIVVNALIEAVKTKNNFI